MSDDFVLLITPVNDAAVVAVPIDDRTIAEDAAFTYALPAGTFTDVDSANLTLTMSPLPAWLSFTAATRTFSGTPGATNVEIVNICVTATDGAGATVRDAFAINIAPNGPAPLR